MSGPKQFTDFTASGWEPRVLGVPTVISAMSGKEEEIAEIPCRLLAESTFYRCCLSISYAGNRKMPAKAHILYTYVMQGNTA